jgi:hypothetical protein
VDKLLVVTSIATILIITGACQSFAAPDLTHQNIIANCEILYSDFTALGKEKFEQRYFHNKDTRNCIRMYYNPAWDGTDPDRNQQLAKSIDFPSATPIARDVVMTTQIIPKWIKDDATRWYKSPERDDTLLFGLRHLVSLNLIQTPSVLDTRACHGTICISNNDYLRYSISETGKDTILQKHTFYNEGDSLAILIEQLGDTGFDRTYITASRSGLIKDDGCCKYYQFAHPIPLEMGSQVNSVREITITGDLVYDLNGSKRPAFFAVDRTGYYQEVIDKDTGIVLYAKSQNNIRKTVTTTVLNDTNLFSKISSGAYVDAYVPPWLRDPIKWWSLGQITDEEYLNGISYLVKKNVLRL